MSIKVRPVSDAAEKLVTRATAASGEYATQAQGAGATWASNTQAAKDNFGQAIASAGLKDRFARGVAKAGADKYARKIREVGADRFAPGVSAGRPDYVAGVEPYFSTISGLTLSARQPRGSAANYTRVNEVGKALNAKRLALLGSGG